MSNQSHLNGSPVISIPSMASDEGYRSTDVMSDITFAGDLLDPVAVVGLSFKFPGDATSPESFWKMLMEQTCAATSMPEDRANINAFHHRDGSRPGAVSAKYGHFLKEHVGAFDTSFFSISPTEAASMDPQHRILLETAYHALENAGMSLNDVKGSNTGVYAGSFSQDYRYMLNQDPECAPKNAASGATITMLAARLSWFFDLKGPCMQLDTACSSSMVALDVACQALRNGECDTALVGGANVIFSIDAWQTLSSMSFLSPDGRCFSFDKRANGYGRGEGFAVVVLKPLSAALKNGDTIRAVIRSTGSNQDGHTLGITQPSDKSQEALIRSTYTKAGLDFNKTRFFEAHGTGTALGDPTECAAIASVFSSQRKSESPLYVGAVKSNVGHLEGAAGIAGLIKAILVLEKGLIPPNTNFEQLSPRIPAKEMNLTFPLEPIRWPEVGLRRASVNSFGFGGTNSHVVLDDAYHYLEARGLRGHHCTVPSPSVYSKLSQDSNVHSTITSSMVRPLVLTFSASDKSGLSRQLQAYSEHFSKNLEQDTLNPTYMTNLAFTLNHRRTQHSYRTFAICSQPQDLLKLNMTVYPTLQVLKRPVICMVFTGQGSQYATMGIDLLQYEVFRDSMITSAEILSDLGCHWNLLEELAYTAQKSHINDAEYSQPICTALQIAQVDLLRSLNILPSVVIGHSSGEIAAAYAAQGLSHTSAIKVAYFRGLAASMLKQQGLRTGSMLAVGLSASATQLYMEHLTSLSIACYNGPKSVTVSGDLAEIEELHYLLDRDNIFNRVLLTGLAYHSQHMLDIADYYLQSLGDIVDVPIRPYSCRMISSVYERNVSGSELSQAQYWVDNLTKPVKFEQAMLKLFDSDTKRRKLGSAAMKSQITNLVEIGPHSTLQGPLKDCLERVGKVQDVHYTSLLHRKKSHQTSVLEAVSSLFCQGVPVDLGRINFGPEISLSSLMVLPDLPSYRFDHSKIYWHESRISKNYSLREHPRLELLGVPDVDWNTKQPAWRNFIRPSELNWIDDHRVNGKTVYPATGMLVMAIEAVNQIAKIPIGAFAIKEANFKKALIIPESEQGIEVKLYLRNHLAQTDYKSIMYDFACYSYSDNAWQEHCDGVICAERQQSESDQAANREYEMSHTAQLKSLAEAAARCSTPVVKSEMYEYLQSEIHIGYGPRFQKMSNIKCGKDLEAIAEIEVYSDTDIQPHVAHPCTLDATAQLLFVALTQGGRLPMPTTLPTRIENMWIRARDVNCGDTTSRLLVHARSAYQSFRKTASSLVCMNVETKEVVLSIGRLQTTHLTESGPTTAPSSASSDLHYGVTWKPDISLLTTSEIQKYCQVSWKEEKEAALFHAELALTQYYFLMKASKVVDRDQGDRPLHLRRYIEWMDWQIAQLSGNPFTHLIPNWRSRLRDSDYMLQLADRLKQTNSRGELHVRIGQQLKDILSGTVDPLHIILHDGLSDRFYTDVAESAAHSEHVRRYVSLLAHKNPAMKVIELGGGTGGFTSHILEPMSAEGQIRFDDYTFTDISPSFFKHVHQKWDTRALRISTQVLDIEIEPSIQGFEHHAYDVAVAALVLHATANIRSTLENVRKLLRVGGKLILMEIIKPDGIHSAFTFGLCKNWWSSVETERKYSPYLDVNTWDNLLRETGFTGVDFCLQDHLDHVSQETGIIIATAIDPASSTIQVLSSGHQSPCTKTIGQVSLGLDSCATDLEVTDLAGYILVAEETPEEVHIPSSEAYVKPVVILVNGKSQSQLDVAEALVNQLGAWPSSVVTLEDQDLIAPIGDRMVLSLLEMDHQILSSIDELTFCLLKKLLTSVNYLVWLTQDTSRYPEAAMINGLARSLCNERPNMSITTVALDDHAQSAAIIAKNILRCVPANNASDTVHRETEYRLEHAQICIPRLTQLTDLDRAMSRMISYYEPTFENRQIGDCRPLKLSIGTPGLLETLQFVEDESIGERMEPEDVEIEVSCVDLSLMDILTVMGQLDQLTIGFTSTGFVTRIGPQVQGFRQGDRVIVSKLGCMRTRVRQHQELVLPVPDAMPLSEAAALPLTLMTAYRGLVELARIEAGETVLIHSGAGGTGQAAIQVAQLYGAEIFTTVGSADKKKFLMKEYDIPEDHILYSRDLTFAKGIMRMTNNRGVDVLFNSLSGEKFVASWECMAPFGRFVEISKSDVQRHGQLPMSAFAQNVSFHCLDLAGLLIQQPKRFRRTLLTVLTLVKEQKLAVAKPLSIFPVSEIADAFRYLQTGKSIGKAVVQLSNDAVVPSVTRIRPASMFEADATYVIAGGLGGLGRSICRWMCERGAKNVVLLSRSGPRETSHHELLRELRESGVRVEAPACDITLRTALETTIANCLATMPPIRGCIQSTMILKDRIFDNMDHASWLTTTSVKVRGSWNLHQVLPPDLDFFILLSSLAGILGSPAQANYAAGNTYQDALAAYRQSQGLKAISLDVGWMVSEGYVSQNERAQQNMLSSGMRPLAQRDLLSLLDHYCNPALPISDASMTYKHVGLGLELPYTMRTKSIDEPSILHTPIFSILQMQQASSSSSQDLSPDQSAPKTPLSVQLATATDVSAATSLILKALTQKLLRATGALTLTSASTETELNFDTTKPLHGFGVDSLLALELKNWVTKELGAEVTVLELLGGMCVADVAGVVVERSRFCTNKGR